MGLSASLLATTYGLVDAATALASPLLPSRLHPGRRACAAHGRRPPPLRDRRSVDQAHRLEHDALAGAEPGPHLDRVALPCAHRDPAQASAALGHHEDADEAAPIEECRCGDRDRAPGELVPLAADGRRRLTAPPWLPKNPPRR